MMMRKPIWIALALCATTQTSFGQAETTTDNDVLRKLRFGVYVAPTLSMMRPSAGKDGNQTQANGGNKLGFTYGIMADYNFTDNYAIATGLQVNSTGGIITTENPKAADNEVLKSNVNYTLQYLEVPVALKLNTDEIGKFRFFGQAGMSVGFNISKKATYEILQKTAAGDSLYKADTKEKLTGSIGAIAPVVFQMNIGLGLQYKVGPKLDAYAGIFFNNGFAPNVTVPEKVNNFPDFKDGNTRLNNFALRLGFYF
ncbi:MAG: PorT family protein [Chitinophagaceae bacterium]|nr:PorT family protein [Chitinophagaceae bacterium]